MTNKKSWFFKCRYDKPSEAYVLESSTGMPAGRVLVEHDHKGISFSVLNSQHEVALVLEALTGQVQHARLLVPRRAVLDEKSGLAIFGVINLKPGSFDSAYEYESAIGSEVLQIAAEGFPRRLIVRKDGVDIAEIEKLPREIRVDVIAGAGDRDVLLVIGIMAAVCLLMPMQAASNHAAHAPAVLIG